jgi:hypothetical protein
MNKGNFQKIENFILIEMYKWLMAIECYTSDLQVVTIDTEAFVSQWRHSLYADVLVVFVKSL